MEDKDKQEAPIEEAPIQTTEKKFVPKGAMVFFVILMLIFAFIWISFYIIMVTRA